MKSTLLVRSSRPEKYSENGATEVDSVANKRPVGVMCCLISLF